MISFTSLVRNEYFVSMVSRLRLILSLMFSASLLVAAPAFAATSSPVPTQDALKALLEKAITQKNLPTSLTPDPAKMNVTKPWLYSGLRYATAEGCFSAANLSTLSNPKPCLAGNLSSPTTVVLFGSSAVGSWTPAMRVAAATLHVRFASFQYEACDPAYIDGLTANCQAFHKSLPAAIAKLHAKVIICVSGTNAGTDAVNKMYIQRLNQAFSAINAESPNSLMVLWGTTPQLALPAATCLEARPTNVSSCGVTYSRTRYGLGEYGSVLKRDKDSARVAKAVFVPVEQWFCIHNTCPAIIGSSVVYADHMHVTEAYSKTLSTLVTNTLRQLLSRK